MKYIDIYQQIKEKIQLDIFLEGQKIPSIRSLAAEYECSIDTIKRAIQLLVDDQLLYVKDRSGFYVLQKKRALTSIKETDTIDFGSTKANLLTFPYDEFQLCLRKATENYKDELFEYGKSQGLPELIRTLQHWLTTQQLYTSENHLFITTGVQQALFILSRIHFPNQKKAILIEMPSYHLMLDLLHLETIPYYTIDRNQHGLNWERLEYYFKEKDIKFFYTTSRISNPLGLSYTESEKKKLVSLAKKYDVYLVEDDYLADFVTSTNNFPLHFYDDSEHVIYLKSFAKIMFPGLRIGVCLLPTLLIDSFKQYRTLLEIDSSMFSQAALNLYIKSGMFDHQVKQTKQLQDMRNKAFIQAAADSNLFHLNCFHSSKAFATLPKKVSKYQFEKNLANHKIILDDISKHFDTNNVPTENFYSLDLFNLTPDQIDSGIKRLITSYNEASDN